MAYTPVFSKLRLLTIAGGGSMTESGNSTIGYTYAGDGQANGADQSIGISQEGGIRCKVGSGPAAYMGLTSTNTSQDETSWTFGVMWYGGTNYYLIENGQTTLVGGPAPSNIGQQMTPAANDEIQLRKVGVTSGVAEVVVEVLPAGGTWGTDEVIIGKFATKVTTTLYPALRTYVGSESMGPMIFQLGQAQARLPDNSAHMQAEGDSLMTMQIGYLKNMAPFVGCGVTWSDLSVAGSQWNTAGSIGMQNRTGAVNSDWDATRNNGIVAGAGSNDNAVGGKTNATIVTDATAWTAALTNPYALGKHLEGTIPRAGSYADQTARDTGNGTGSSGLKGLNTTFQSSYVSMGFNNFIDRRPTGSEMDFGGFTQTYFDNAGIWYVTPSFQEAWSGSIHPYDRLAYNEAKRASVSMVAYMVPNAVALVGAGTVNASGSATLTTRVALAAAGATKATGAATLTARVALVGAGFASAVGAASLNVRAALVGSGQAAAIGVATLTTGSSGAALTAGGIAAANGNGTLTTRAALAGAGVTPAIGGAALTTRVLLVGTGQASANGSAALTTGTSGAALAGAGTCGANGSGALTTQAALVGAGQTVAVGAAALSTAVALSGGGFSIVTGAGVLTVSAGGVSFVAAGASAASGAAALTTRAALSGAGVAIATAAGVLTVGSSGVQFLGAGSAGASGAAALSVRVLLAGFGLAQARGVGTLSVVNPYVAGSATGKSTGNQLGRPAQLSTLSRRGASSYRRN